MKISILLPYKENFSPEYAGAVSIFIKDKLDKNSWSNLTQEQKLEGIWNS